MRFSTVFSVLAVSAVALAGAPPNGDVSNGDPSNGPDAPAPQNATDFKSAFNGLGQQSGPPLLELGNCQDDSCTSQAVNDIVNAIKPCNSSLAPVPAGTGSDDDANTLLDFTTVSLGKFPRSDALLTALAENRERSQRPPEGL